MIKILLPNGNIIERKPIAKTIGNYCQLYVRYKKKIYAVGDGDEYLRGMPDIFKLKYLCSEVGPRYILYPENIKEMEKNPSKKAYYKDYIELPNLITKKNDNEKKYFATEIVQAVDEIKKTFLMCEYFGRAEDFVKAATGFDIMELRKKNNLEEFYNEVKSFLDEKIVPLIDNAVREELEAQDYEVYTNKHHHRKFWNEIPLPEIAEGIVNAYKFLAGLEYTENSNYAVSIYDLSDEEFYFDSKKDMEAFLKIEDIVPYTVYKIKKGTEGNMYVELYSA